MERSQRVGVVRATFEWDDVGSWEALARTRRADISGNVVVGSGTAVEASGNIVFAEEGHVYLLGVDDLVVVRAGEKIAVMPRSRAADLKDLLARVDGTDS
jgi:mannose-1-phosphate guanylyltransferase